MWVIVGVLVGVAVVAVFVFAVFAWILKTVIERFIGSVDEGAKATTRLTQGLESYKIVVDGSLERIEQRQQHAQEIIDLQFKQVHTRLDKGAAFHQEIRDWKPVVDQELGTLKSAMARKSDRRTTKKVESHAGNDKKESGGGG